MNPYEVSKRNCQRDEKICDNNLAFANEHLGWFSTLTRQEDGSRIDYVGTARDGRPVHIELKTRGIHINDYDTIYQDVKKMDAELRDFEENHRVPLFLNFMNDKEHVWIIDLSTLDLSCLKRKWQWVWDEAKGEHGWEEKYHIPTKSGHYYEYDSKQDKYNRKW